MFYGWVLRFVSSRESSTLHRHCHCGGTLCEVELEKNLEPAPVSFTLPHKGNSKDLHTLRQDHYFLAVLEPAWSV